MFVFTAVYCLYLISNVQSCKKEEMSCENEIIFNIDLCQNTKDYLSVKWIFFRRLQEKTLNIFMEFCMFS